MAVTISFRGRLRDLERVETLEDRIVELSMDVGGYAQIWRSSCEATPQRVVRGVLLDLSPGLDPVSLLISPEGCLTPIDAVERAERGPLGELPWLAVSADYGGLEGHVMLVELLAALREEFIPDLEVKDEGGYFETRDGDALYRFREERQAKAKGVAADHSPAVPHPWTPELQAARREGIARIAQRIRRAVVQPPEHPPARFARGDEEDEDARRYGTEEEWDASYRESRRKQQQLMRAFEERTVRGTDPGKAFEEALRSEGIVDLPGADEEGHSNRWAEEAAAAADDTGEGDAEAWRRSAEDAGTGDGGGGPDAGAAVRKERAAEDGGEADAEDLPDDDEDERHPLVRRVKDLTTAILKLPARNESGRGGPIDVLVRGVLELTGGLVQALGSPEDPDLPFGLRLVQLKRAARGAAFALGALLPARAAGLLESAEFARVLQEVREIEQAVQVEVEKTRGEM